MSERIILDLDAFVPEHPVKIDLVGDKILPATMRDTRPILTRVILLADESLKDGQGMGVRCDSSEFFVAKVETNDRISTVLAKGYGATSFRATVGSKEQSI